MQESDIRPTDLFAKYLELCAQDAHTYFSATKRDQIPCPACADEEYTPVFEKWGFQYVACKGCGTLYQSPRPSRGAFDHFYQESPSAQYWASTFFPAVAEARREHLFRPKVREIVQFCQARQFVPQVVADIGAGYGIFLEEWRRLFPDATLLAIEPNPDLAEICRIKGLTVIESFAEDVAEYAHHIDLLIAFELIEHIYDPLGFCRSLKNLLSTGGKLLLTGLTVDGFDIQVLWEQSRSVAPPHHINFLSVQGFEQLLLRSGFTDVSVSTPGKLDVDIVKNALNEGIQLSSEPRFLKTLFERGEHTLAEFQKFLSQHKLSSHCWVWAARIG